MWNVVDVYEDSNKKSLEEIEYVRGLYELQTFEVEKAKHIEELLLKDYVRTIKSYITRYDLIDGIFSDAQKQMGNKLKKDRHQFEALKKFIMEDFLNNDKNFKIIKFMQCGYEGYAWRIEFEGYGKDFSIHFPVKKNITTENLRYANYGKFNFSVKEGNSCWNVIKSSYITKDIAETIRDYFGLEMDNSQEKDYE